MMDDSLVPSPASHADLGLYIKQSVNGVILYLIKNKNKTKITINSLNKSPLI